MPGGDSILVELEGEGEGWERAHCIPTSDWLTSIYFQARNLQPRQGFCIFCCCFCLHLYVCYVLSAALFILKSEIN
jgi:hypothetical protein